MGSAWAGHMSWPEAKRRILAYERRLKTILPRLTPGLRRFAKDKSFSLHDGVIRRVVLDYGRSTLALSWRCDRLGRGGRFLGYCDLNILYKGVPLRSPALGWLALMTWEHGTVLMADELDLARGGYFQHRILYLPRYQELSIVFRDLEYQRIPRRKWQFKEHREKFKTVWPSRGLSPKKLLPGPRESAIR